MGRVVTKNIKNIVKEILEQHKDKFTSEFDKNKHILSQLYIVQSKKLRNKIAGYITFLIKKLQKK